MQPKDSPDAAPAAAPAPRSAARRKAVQVSTAQLARESTLHPGNPLPLVLQPALDDVDLGGFVRQHLDVLRQRLARHGAILFRGFAVGSAAAFEQLAAAFGPLFEEYGDLPRGTVSGRIYQSTPYPPDQPILFHNESSHMDRWPLMIWFYCVQPPQSGGETVVADCRAIYRRLPAELADRFERQGLLYVRNFIPGIDVGWQEFFRTGDRREVEAACRAAGVACEWKGDALATRQRRVAVARHPATGEKLFFNQIQLHHVACLPEAVQAPVRALFAAPDLPRNVLYGDGAAIEDEVVAEIRRLYDENSVAAPWQRHDVLLADNMMTAHARNPFTGPRKILVAMGQMSGEHELEPRP